MGSFQLASIILLQLKLVLLFAWITMKRINEDGPRCCCGGRHNMLWLTYPKASVCFSCRHCAVLVCNVSSIQLIKDFYQQRHLLWNDLYYPLTVCFLLHTEWRTRALSWCRLPLCWKPIHTQFLLGITSLMVPGASCPGPLTFSWPLMRLRYLFRHSGFSLK